MALAAIIVARQSVDYRRGSSNKVALAQDPFAQELAAVAPDAGAARRAQAEQLLAKARREMQERGPAINKLLEHSVELETRLAAQEKAEKQMADAVQVAQHKVDALKAKDAKLHMTIGWPQAGGAMPTTYPAFDGASSLADGDGVDAASIQAAGKAIAAQYAAQNAPLAAAAAEMDDEDGGPLRAGDLDNGVDAAAIRAAAAAIAQAYADRGSSIESGSADDWQGEALRPGKQQHTTSRHGEGMDDAWSDWQRHEEDMGYPSSGGYDSSKPDAVIVVDGTSGVTSGSWWDDPRQWFKAGSARCVCVCVCVCARACFQAVPVS